MLRLNETVNQRSKLVLSLIFFLALLRGGIYASFLPPWGLLDEEQHLHYVQYLVEQQMPPLVGKTYLSPEIIQSVFETRRHATFHWPTPTSRDPREMGLEGHSYEGYQPPLFYTIAVPFYMALPDDILIKLYGIRWVTVGLSLLTVWFVYRTTLELFPSQRLLVYLSCLLLILIPERTMSIARVNNDVLLEVIGAAFVWLCVRVRLKGFSSFSQSQLLGLLFGAGILTKVSMLPSITLLIWVFWSQRHKAGWHWHVLGGGGIAALLMLPLFLRNLYLYGDLTGLAGFKTMSNFTQPELTLSNSFIAISELFRNFWVIWWKGSEVSSNLAVNIFYLLLAGIAGVSMANIIGYLRGRYRPDHTDNYRDIYVMFIITLSIYILAILKSYFTGEIPVIQGRFLLPVIIPIVILFSWGLWQTGAGQAMLIITLGLLSGIDIASLWGNLLPYFYYWSFFVENHLPPLSLPAEWVAAWEIVYLRFLHDKPAGLRPFLAYLLLLYLLTWLSTLMLLWQEYKGARLGTSIC